MFTHLQGGKKYENDYVSGMHQACGLRVPGGDRFCRHGFVQRAVPAEDAGQTRKVIFIRGYGIERPLCGALDPVPVPVHFSISCFLRPIEAAACKVQSALCPPSNG